MIEQVPEERWRFDRQAKRPARRLSFCGNEL